MSGAFGDMGNLLKQAQKMQRAMDDAREELKAARLEGTAGGGMVNVTVTGEGAVERVELSDEVVRLSNKEMLEELLLAALRDGIGKAARLREERLAQVTGGLQLPGIF